MVWSSGWRVEEIGFDARLALSADALDGDAATPDGRQQE
jgi:hypothetical protein